MLPLRRAATATLIRMGAHRVLLICRGCLSLLSTYYRLEIPGLSRGSVRRRGYPGIRNWRTNSTIEILELRARLAPAATHPALLSRDELVYQTARGASLGARLDRLGPLAPQ